MAAVRLRELSKTFRTGFRGTGVHRALDRVSLDVSPGAVLGYLGPNGAGKTTTLRLLMQLVHPTAGSAEILGRPAGDAAVRRRIGFLPEAVRFCDTCTAEELLEYVGGLFGYPPAERRRRAALGLDRVGIGAERRRKLRTYSRGMLQRVGIAQALLNDPEVVFLDEPLTGLDPLGRRDVRHLILALRDEGRTVFVSSHALHDAEAVCSHVAILNRGRLVAADRIADLDLDVRGWKLVAAGAREAVAAAGGTAPGSITRVADDRYAFDLPDAAPPDALLAELTRRGVRIVSLSPQRESLESYFLRRVTEDATDAAARPSEDRRLGAALAAGPRSEDPPLVESPARRGGLRVMAVIARQVLRGALRNRVLHGAALLAIGLAAAAPIAGRLTAGQDVKVVKDLGLAAINLGGLFVAVFLGVAVVAREIDNRTVDALLAKPIRRHEFLLGQYGGILATLALFAAVMTGAMYAVLAASAWWSGAPGLVSAPAAPAAPAADPALLQAVFLLFVQQALIAAAAFCLATFASPVPSAAAAGGLWVAGHFGAELRHFDAVVDSRLAASLAAGLSYLLPDLAAFDVQAAVVHAQPVSAGYLLLTAASGAAYILAFLALALVIFTRRDLL